VIAALTSCVFISATRRLTICFLEHCSGALPFIGYEFHPFLDSPNTYRLPTSAIYLHSLLKAQLHFIVLSVFRLQSPSHPQPCTTISQFHALSSRGHYIHTTLSAKHNSKITNLAPMIVSRHPRPLHVSISHADDHGESYHPTFIPIPSLHTPPRKLASTTATYITLSTQLRIPLLARALHLLDDTLDHHC
jgi:hypothetical protein